MGQAEDPVGPPEYRARVVGDVWDHGLSSDPETRQIHQDIEDTRVEMDETIDTLQRRLDPERLIAQAKEAALEVTHESVDKAKEAVREVASDARGAVRGATIGRVEQMARDLDDMSGGAGSGMMDTIKANPIPAAMVGIGLGWLFMSRRRTVGMEGWYSGVFPEHSHGHGYIGTHVHSESGMGSTIGQMPDRAGEIVGQTREAASGLVDQAKGTTSEVVGQVRDTTGELVGQVRNTAGQIMTGAGDLAGTASERAMHFKETAVREVPTRFDHMLNETPLAIGALALGIGAAIGLAIPTTSRERELMGDARETFMERTQQVAQDAQQQIQRVAERVQETAQEETHKTPDITEGQQFAA
jgi:uncharacterized protein YjbJ (UPF0337 family)